MGLVDRYQSNIAQNFRIEHRFLISFSLDTSVHSLNTCWKCCTQVKSNPGFKFIKSNNKNFQLSKKSPQLHTTQIQSHRRKFLLRSSPVQSCPIGGVTVFRPQGNPSYQHQVAELNRFSQRLISILSPWETAASQIWVNKMKIVNTCREVPLDLCPKSHDLSWQMWCRWGTVNLQGEKTSQNIRRDVWKPHLFHRHWWSETVSVTLRPDANEQRQTTPHWQHSGRRGHYILLWVWASC